ncbi:MAG: helix-turn-helix domain-containing protein [Lachnospiraceae bacterium]
MYTNAGYLNFKDADYEDLGKSLIVKSCGVYRLLEREDFNTCRPFGRRDYQLIFVASGVVYVNYEGASEIVPAGHMLLYRPGVAQDYTYCSKDKPEVYWIHFTGSEVETVLLHNGFSPAEHVVRCGSSPEYQQLFLRIIRELQVPKPRCEELILLLFQQILLLMYRSLQEDSGANPRIQKEVEHAVHFFNENLSSPISIQEYAADRHMSTCWFIRSFRQYIGMTPMQYITGMRIAKARWLLENTGYNITEISELVGYDNPLYFSRIFKKQTGLSPVHYRKELAERMEGK